jgi:hypothetical protein
MVITSRLLLRALVVLLCLSACAPLSLAQTGVPDRWENGITESWWFDEQKTSKEDVAAARSLWRAIEAENSETPNEWAGDYFIGNDTHGSYMRWSRQNGFVLAHVDKCQAMLMGISYGKVNSTPTLIRFLSNQPAGQASHPHAHRQKMTMNFVPVVWRGVHRLIPANEMSDFGDYVAGLGKYNEWLRDGFFYIEAVEFFSKHEAIARTDSSISKTEEQDVVEDIQPIVPPGYERYLKKPIEARITSVGAGNRKVSRENEWWDDFVIPVTINAGSAEGLKPKMVLRLIGAKGFGGFGEAVEVKHVGLHSSKGIIIRTIRKSPCVKFAETDDCQDTEYEAVSVGWQVSTSPFK